MITELLNQYWLAIVSETVFFLVLWFILRRRSNVSVENYLPEKIVAQTVKIAILENWRNDENSIMRQLDRKYQ